MRADREDGVLTLDLARAYATGFQAYHLPHASKMDESLNRPCLSYPAQHPWEKAYMGLPARTT
jgi:hypothetical protein